MSTKKMYTLSDLIKNDGELSVAEFLSSWRRCDEMSQKEFAKKIGISPANLCDIEKGRKGISLLKAYKIAKIIGYPPAALIQLALQDELRASKLKFKISVAA